jgi:2'-5' RNA ligase
MNHSVESEKRIFFALWPSDRQREELRDTISPAVSNVEGKVIYRGDWHVTLVFIGDFPEARLDELREATAPIVVRPFRMRFDRLDFWPRPKIACLTTASVAPELMALVADLEAAVRPLGIEVEDRRYRPHITVARRVRAFTPEPLARPVTLEWSTFELMESVSTGRGVEYRPLKQRLPRDS